MGTFSASTTNTALRTPSSLSRDRSTRAGSVLEHSGAQATTALRTSLWRSVRSRRR